jgi:DNA polymerase III subunit delta
MTEAEFKKEVKAYKLGKGPLCGVYFLYGDEDYTKNACVRDIRDYINDNDPMAQLNMISLDYSEGEIELGDIENALASPPMMSDTKTVIVSFSSFDSSFPSRKAKNDSDGDGSKKKEKEESAVFETFLSILTQHRDDSDVLLIIKVSSVGFDSGNVSRLKKLDGAAKCVSFDYNTPDMLRKWLCRHAAGYGIEVSPQALDYILGCCGRNMYTLLGEIEKVSAYCAQKNIPIIGINECAECCSRTEEDSAFGLVNALTGGNTSAAYSMLGVKMRLRVSPDLLLGQIAKNYTDLAAAAYFIADGREVSDFASAMKINPKRANVLYSSAKKRSPAYFSYAVQLCAAANKNMRSVNSKGYGELEVLVSRLSPAMFTEPEKEDDGNDEN